MPTMSVEIEMAEQQLTGYAHAKAGFGVVDLAESMGLTPSEWNAIQSRGHVCLNDADSDALSAYLGTK